MSQWKVRALAAETAMADASAMIQEVRGRVLELEKEKDERQLEWDKVVYKYRIATDKTIKENQLMKHRLNDSIQAGNLVNDEKFRLEQQLQAVRREVEELKNRLALVQTPVVKIQDPSPEATRFSLLEVD